MLKKKKVKTIYVTQRICDKCGGSMVPTYECITTFPAQYPYRCIKCDNREIYSEYNIPGKTEYEFEEDENYV